MEGDVVWMQAAEFPYFAATLPAMAGVEGLHWWLIRQGGEQS